MRLSTFSALRRDLEHLVLSGELLVEHPACASNGTRELTDLQSCPGELLAGHATQI
jgi:hypothetical protein